MKVCIFGAGAVGSHVAARLSAAGAAEVAVVARGPQLEAIRTRGLTLRTNGQEISGRPAHATDDPARLAPQDLVLVALKATSLPGAADAIARLLAPEGVAAFLNNGITWWWPHGLRGGRGPLPLLDPQGTLWAQLRARALGCVVNAPNEMVEPGVVLHSGRCLFTFGEPDGSSSARVERVAEVFRSGGMGAAVSTDLRREIWAKLLLNASGNTLAALTRLSLLELATDPALRAMMAQLMRETLEVAAALGWDLRGETDVESLAQRGDRKPGPRPSMLQDVLLGRALEVDALLGQTQAFAREAGVAVPTTDAILPLLRGLDRSRASPAAPAAMN